MGSSATRPSTGIARAGAVVTKRCAKKMTVVDASTGESLRPSDQTRSAMPIDPMTCTQADLLRLVATHELPLDVTYDRRLVDGTDTLFVQFPKWVVRMPKCTEFVAEFVARIRSDLVGVKCLRIVIGAVPQRYAMPAVAVRVDGNGHVTPCDGVPRG